MSETKEFPSDRADKFVVRFPEGMRDRIKAEADANNRSMNAEIIQRLQDSFIPWEERPWEERMIVDIDRAMLKLLSDHERNALLDRVKIAGGAETVNQTTLTTLLQENNDLRKRMSEKPSVKRSDSTDKAFEAADELAFAVLQLVGRYLPDNRDTEEEKRLREQLKVRIETKRAKKDK